MPEDPASAAVPENMSPARAPDTQDPFSAWALAWIRLGRYSGAAVPDVDERIADTVDLWRRPIPTDTWRRNEDARLLDPARRFCRSNDDDVARRRGEHVIEYELLHPDPDTTETRVMGARLIDGVNAVPLARDIGGGRAGNVEADMLLLVQDTTREFRLELVEVKVAANDAWYAAVENLRQLRLISESPETLGLFRRRRPDLRLPVDVAVSGLVLAPPAFFHGRGKKRNAVVPAQTLLHQMHADAGVEVRFGIWEPGAIRPLESPSPHRANGPT